MSLAAVEAAKIVAYTAPPTDGHDVEHAATNGQRGSSNRL